MGQKGFFGQKRVFGGFAPDDLAGVDARHIARTIQRQLPVYGHHGTRAIRCRHIKPRCHRGAHCPRFRIGCDARRKASAHIRQQRIVAKADVFGIELGRSQYLQVGDKAGGQAKTVDHHIIPGAKVVRPAVVCVAHCAALGVTYTPLMGCKVSARATCTTPRSRKISGLGKGLATI